MSANDFGTVINPTLMEGRLRGATSQVLTEGTTGSLMDRHAPMATPRPAFAAPAFRAQGVYDR